MAKQTTPKPKADAPAQDAASQTAAGVTEPKTEDATAPGAEGSPTPPAMGNEGPAEAAGEGQSSPANPEALPVPEDAVTLSEAIRAYDAKRIGRGQTEPSVIVTGPKAGRWRIGRHFGPEAVSIREGDLSPEQLSALMADPSLSVVIVDTPY